MRVCSNEVSAYVSVGLANGTGSALFNGYTTLAKANSGRSVVGTGSFADHVAPVLLAAADRQNRARGSGSIE